MAQADQLDLLKLLLEVNLVGDPGPVYQQLYEHGVTTITKFAELSVETLREWGIIDDNVWYSTLPHARRLLVDSSHNLAAIRQQLLVRACMHYMYVRCSDIINIHKEPWLLWAFSRKYCS